MKLERKRTITVLLVNAALIVAGIAVLELVFGDWVRPNSLNKLNIVRSRTIKFDVEGLYETSHKTVSYTRDRYGLRGSFRDPSEIDILTVGGSTTDQRFITDGETWQDVIQSRFSSAGKRVVVGNAGVDGQSTYGHIKNFDWWFSQIPGLRPKYILFYVGVNDFYKDENNKFDALVENQKGSIRAILREKSALYHVTRTLYGLYLARFRYRISHLAVDFSKLEWTTVPLCQSYDEMMDLRLRKYEERLAVLIQRTVEFGSTPIFVTQPSRKYRLENGTVEGVRETIRYDSVDINGVDYFYMTRKMDDVVASVSERSGVLCINMARETFWEDNDFYDFAHMTPKGAEKVGDYLFNILKDKF